MLLIHGTASYPSFPSLPLPYDSAPHLLVLHINPLLRLNLFPCIPLLHPFSIGVHTIPSFISYVVSHFVSPPSPPIHPPLVSWGGSCNWEESRCPAACRNTQKTGILSGMERKATSHPLTQLTASLLRSLVLCLSQVMRLPWKALLCYSTRALCY